MTSCTGQLGSEAKESKYRPDCLTLKEVQKTTNKIATSKATGAERWYPQYRRLFEMEIPKDLAELFQYRKIHP